MANVSYCRFQNTLSDLIDCYKHIDDINLLEGEEKARKDLITICREIAEMWPDDEEV